MKSEENEKLPFKYCTKKNGEKNKTLNEIKTSKYYK